MSKANNDKQKEFLDNMFKELDDPLGHSIKHMPTKPDPLWPDGAAPLHMSRAQQEKSKKTNAYGELRAVDWHCEKCGKDTEPSPKNPKLCKSCVALESQNSALSRKINSDWMEVAKDLGLEIFERQPEETDTEWRIWDAYRRMYPAKLPTYKELSELVDCSQGTVVKAAQKWSFKVRLAAWARYADADIQEKRIIAIREMNEKHISMAKTINTKLETALEKLDPEFLKPGEIVNLFRVATELERKATTYVDEKVDNVVVEAAASTKQLTKPEDLNEILGILLSVGAMGGKSIGLKTTTELVVKQGGNDDN